MDFKLNNIPGNSVYTEDIFAIITSEILVNSVWLKSRVLLGRVTIILVQRRMFRWNITETKTYFIKDCICGSCKYFLGTKEAPLCLVYAGDMMHFRT